MNIYEEEKKVIYDVPIVPRNHQIKVEDARKLRIVDLFAEEYNGEKQLSRADLILIYTVYDEGLQDFLYEYLEYVEKEVETKGYKVVNKPHFYLKSIIG